MSNEWADAGKELASAHSLLITPSYAPSAGSLGAREPSSAVRSPASLAADDCVSESGAVPSSTASFVVTIGSSFEAEFASAGVINQ